MDAAARVLIGKRRMLDEDEMMVADGRQRGGQLARGMRGARAHDARCAARGRLDALGLCGRGAQGKRRGGGPQRMRSTAEAPKLPYGGETCR
jgi:hypothetical protein